jgi:hypothetical protein
MNNFSPVLIAALLCAYAWLRIRILSAIQPKRLELARRGETLLANPALNADAKDYVRFLLGHVFGMRVFLIFAILIMPVVVIALIAGFKAIDLHKAIANKEARLDLIEFEQLHDEITWANNPILKTIIELEYFVVGAIAIVIRLIFVGSSQIRKETVILISEKALARLQRELTARTA